MKEKIYYIILAVAIALLVYTAIQTGRIASFMSEGSQAVGQDTTRWSSLTVWQGQATQIINALIQQQIKK